MGRICRKKEGFKSGMKEREGDEKLIIISVAIRGINDTHENSLGGRNFLSKALTIYLLD